MTMATVEVAVEILSESDARDRDWNANLQKYRRAGVRELVRLDPDCEPPSLRIWDSVDGDLVERGVTEKTSPSRYLPGSWTVVPDQVVGALLRLKREDGVDFYPTARELEAAARELQASALRSRNEEADARARAEARVRELEAELRRRG